MNEWKTIPPGTVIHPDLSTWRRSDICDNETVCMCRGYLVLEDLTRIDCIIGYKFIFTLDDSEIIPVLYREVERD